MNNGMTNASTEPGYTLSMLYQHTTWYKHTLAYYKMVLVTTSTGIACSHNDFDRQMQGW